MEQLVQNLILGLLLGGVYALAAGGLTLIFGVMRVINIAHGAFLILAAFITYSLWSGLGIDPLLAIAITTPVVFVIGWVTYKLFVAPIRTAPMASTVLLTFGIALVVHHHRRLLSYKKARERALIALDSLLKRYSVS